MSFQDDPNCAVCWTCPTGSDSPAVTLANTRGWLVAFLEYELRNDADFGTWLTGAEMAADEAAGLATVRSKNGF